MAYLDSYMSVVEALKHSCLQNKVNLDLVWIDADNYEIEDLKNLNGVVVPGGFGYRGIEGKIGAIEFLRKNKARKLMLTLIEKQKEFQWQDWDQQLQNV